MLKDLKINKKEISVAFPRFKDFKLKMKYVTREELAAIREKTTTISYNRLSKAREETIDTDRFMDSYLKEAVVGWSGLTYEILSFLVPIETDGIDLSKEIPYSHEDAMWLVKNSSEFDGFISETMSQVDVFSQTKREEQIKK
jgi:hypothetical protein